jgi:hypothetical protein
LAANEETAVNMKHLKHAAQMEYAKLGKPLAEIEIGGLK